MSASSALRVSTPPAPSDWGTFFRQHHRLPTLNDDPPAYQWKGWMLPYVVLAHRVITETGDRWSYHLRLLEADTLPPDPIPPLRFLHSPHAGTMNAVRRWVLLAEEHGRSWDGFAQLIDWLAFALNVGQTPSTMPEKVQATLYREVGIHQLLQQPYDYFGELLSERRGNGWNPHAFYPTPMGVADMMVRMTMDQSTLRPDVDPRTQTVCDPAVGSGCLILAASQFSLRCFGIDKDSLVCKIAAINAALYAPWIAFPLPERLFPEPATPLPAAEDLNPLGTFSLHTHQSYAAMTQTAFAFDEPAPAVGTTERHAVS